ncbi:ribulose phosphate epimerase [Mycolicibacterium litorale]|nr:ribulose phosphate epimerase [Mycolicibacterium litorale]
MTTTLRLAPWHSRFAGKIAGSVDAVPPAQRPRTARELAAAGLAVHVEITVADESSPAGVSIAELRDIAEAIVPHRLGVHLVGSPAFVDSVLSDVLRLRPAKVFLPWSAFTPSRATTVRAAGSAAWIALWTEWDGIGVPRWPAAPDGVLVLLAEPGTLGPGRLGRLGMATACAAELPVIVGGGVTEELAPLCITAGAQSLVVGRGLLTSARGDLS